MRTGRVRPARRYIRVTAAGADRLEAALQRYANLRPLVIDPPRLEPDSGKERDSAPFPLALALLCE